MVTQRRIFGIPKFRNIFQRNSKFCASLCIRNKSWNLCLFTCIHIQSHIFLPYAFQIFHQFHRIPVWLARKRKPLLLRATITIEQKIRVHVHVKRIAENKKVAKKNYRIVADNFYEFLCTGIIAASLFFPTTGKVIRKNKFESTLEQGKASRQRNKKAAR